MNEGKNKIESIIVVVKVEREREKESQISALKLKRQLEEQIIEWMGDVGTLHQIQMIVLLTLIMVGSYPNVVLPPHHQQFV
jgi:hypothetical protein